MTDCAMCGYEIQDHDHNTVEIQSIMPLQSKRFKDGLYKNGDPYKKEVEICRSCIEVLDKMIR